MGEDSTGFSIVARYPRCGDGVRDLGAEQCDDGNTSNNDGCSSTCEYEGSNIDAVCIPSMHKAGGNVSKIQMKDALWCLRLYSKGKVGSMIDCTTADSRSKVVAAAAQTSIVDATMYTTAPPVAYTGADATNAATVSAAVFAMSDLLGTPLDDRVAQLRDDKSDAKCQQVVSRSVANIMKLGLKTHEKCVRALTRDNGITSSAALGQCLATTVNVERSGTTINKLTLRARGKVARACRTTGIDSFSSSCDENQTIAQCDERVAACAVCTTANGIGGIGADCDTHDDGVANGSCGS